MVLLALALGGCGTASGPRKPGVHADRPGCCRGGGYYLDDGPGGNPPANLDEIPDAVPRIEPINRATSRPYSVMGRSYAPMATLTPYRERGIATWYGRRYHGRQTASGEAYDMYSMTAAHTTLPIPSYARVTNVDNGRSVVVRINDRGPFLGGRLIDVSYVAAHKLEIVRSGSGLVDVEAIHEPGTYTASRVPAEPQPAPAAAPVAAVPSPAASPPATPSSSSTLAEPNPLSAAPAPPMAATPAGHYVQLAAFSVKENAERFIERVRTLLDGDQAPISAVPAGSLFRIHAGPYADRLAAEAAARRFEALLGSPAVLTAPR